MTTIARIETTVAANTRRACAVPAALLALAMAASSADTAVLVLVGAKPVSLTDLAAPLAPLSGWSVVHVGVAATGLLVAAAVAVTATYLVARGRLSSRLLTALSPAAARALVPPKRR